MNLPFHDRRKERVEALLRAGAQDFGPAPSPALRGRILATLRAAPPRASAPPVHSRPRAGAWLAVAAAVLVLGGAWWLTRAAGPAPTSSPFLVRVTRGVFGAGKDVLALPQEAESNLRLEAERLLADTTRAAQLVVRGLPGPLRERLEQM